MSRRQIGRWLGVHLRSDHRGGRLYVAAEDVEELERRAGLVDDPDHSVAIVRALDAGEPLPAIVARVGAPVVEVERVAAWYALTARPIIVPPALVERLAGALGVTAPELLAASAAELVERVERLRGEILALLARATLAS